MILLGFHKNLNRWDKGHKNHWFYIFKSLKAIFESFFNVVTVSPTLASLICLIDAVIKPTSPQLNFSTLLQQD